MVLSDKMVDCVLRNFVKCVTLRAACDLGFSLGMHPSLIGGQRAAWLCKLTDNCKSD